MAGGYRAVKWLGDGPFGQAWQVQDAADQVFVLKVLRDSFMQRATGGAEGFHRLTEAVEIYRSVHHPNLAAVYGVVSDPAKGVYGMLTEAVSGAQITHVELPADIRAQADRQAVAEIVAWFEQLSQLLFWLHGKAFVHGNLKPSNVRLPGGPQGHYPKLLDLPWSAIGLAAPEAGKTSFLAPEQRVGGPPSPRSDQWAVAAMLSEVMRPLLARLPNELNDTIQRAAQADPGARFSDLAELAMALGRARGELLKPPRLQQRPSTPFGLPQARGLSETEGTGSGPIEVVRAGSGDMPRSGSQPSVPSSGPSVWAPDSASTDPSVRPSSQPRAGSFSVPTSAPGPMFSSDGLSATSLAGSPEPLQLTPVDPLDSVDLELSEPELAAELSGSMSSTSPIAADLEGEFSGPYPSQPAQRSGFFWVLLLLALLLGVGGGWAYWQYGRGLQAALQSPDAGPVADAGLVTDAGAPEDAGAAADAGVSDAGQPPDAGEAPAAAAVEPPVAPVKPEPVPVAPVPTPPKPKRRAVRVKPRPPPPRAAPAEPEPEPEPPSAALDEAMERLRSSEGEPAPAAPAEKPPEQPKSQLDRLRDQCDRKVAASACTRAAAMLIGMGQTTEAAARLERACDMRLVEGCIRAGRLHLAHAKMQDALRLYNKACVWRSGAGCHSAATLTRPKDASAAEKLEEKACAYGRSASCKPPAPQEDEAPEAKSPPKAEAPSGSSEDKSGEDAEDEPSEESAL